MTNLREGAFPRPDPNDQVQKNRHADGSVEQDLPDHGIFDKPDSKTNGLPDDASREDEKHAMLMCIGMVCLEKNRHLALSTGNLSVTIVGTAHSLIAVCDITRRYRCALSA